MEAIGDSLSKILKKTDLVVSDGQKLKTAFFDQQAQIEDLKNRLSDRDDSIKVVQNQLLAQGRRLHEYKKLRMLRDRNRELTVERDEARKSLDKLSVLECRICTAVGTVIAFTPCGHGPYCGQCTTFCLRDPGVSDGLEDCCPKCSQPVEEKGLIKIALCSGPQAASPVAGEDTATDILDGDSD